MSETRKLYRVKTRSPSCLDQISYVVATNSHDAYSKVREDFDRRDIGFPSDREMVQVELLAEESIYPFCDSRLYLPNTFLT